MKLTPAQVKNLIRRGLRFLVDPEPEPIDKHRIRAYFGDQCAYCGKRLAPGDGDIDHLVSAAQGGANSLANRVLSCKACNAEEKRDQHWVNFMRAKCSDSTILERRMTRVHAWIASNGGHPVIHTDVLALVNAEAKRVTEEYDVACKRIRELLKATNRRDAD